MAKHFPAFNQLAFYSHRINDSFDDIVCPKHRVMFFDEFEQYQILLHSKNGRIFKFIWGKVPTAGTQAVERGTVTFKRFSKLVHELSAYEDLWDTKKYLEDGEVLYWKLEQARPYDPAEVKALQLVGQTSLIRGIIVPGSRIKRYQLRYDNQVLEVECEGCSYYEDGIDEFIEVDYHVNEYPRFLSNTPTDLIRMAFIETWNEISDPVKLFKSRQVQVLSESDYRKQLVDFDLNALHNHKQAQYDRQAPLGQVINEHDAEVIEWSDGNKYVISGIAKLAHWAFYPYWFDDHDRVY